MNNLNGIDNVLNTILTNLKSQNLYVNYHHKSIEQLKEKLSELNPHENSEQDLDTFKNSIINHFHDSLKKQEENIEKNLKNYLDQQHLSLSQQLKIDLEERQNTIKTELEQEIKTNLDRQHGDLETKLKADIADVKCIQGENSKDLLLENKVSEVVKQAVIEATAPSTKTKSIKKPKASSGTKKKSDPKAKIVEKTSEVSSEPERDILDEA